MALTANFGALRFSLAWVWHGVPPDFDSRPVLLWEEAPVVVARLGDEEFLVLDHRAEPGGLARVEFWTTTGSCEGSAPDLLLIGDARPGAAAASGSLCDVLMQGHVRGRPPGAQRGRTG